MLSDPFTRSAAPRIVRAAEVRARLGISRAKFSDMLSRGQFPRPFVIVPGGRAVGWLEGDVDIWITDRRDGQGRGQ